MSTKNTDLDVAAKIQAFRKLGARKEHEKRPSKKLKYYEYLNLKGQLTGFQYFSGSFTIYSYVFWQNALKKFQEDTPSSRLMSQNKRKVLERKNYCKILSNYIYAHILIGRHNEKHRYNGRHRY